MIDERKVAKQCIHIHYTSCYWINRWSSLLCCTTI